MDDYKSPTKLSSQSREEYIQKTFAKVSRRPHFIGILSKLDEKHKTYLLGLAKQFETELQLSSSEVVASPNKTKKGAAESFLFELEMKLQAYDSSDTSTTIDINFGEVIFILGNSIEKDSIKELHEKLIKYGTSAKIVDLVVSTTRGKLYSEWKTKNPSEDFFQTFGISPRQGNRYIQFYNLIKKYPRLLISGFSFTELVTREKEIEEKASGNHSFDALLKGPLKEFKIGDDLFDIQAQLERTTNMQVNLE